jgi:hypothetical protein
MKLKFMAERKGRRRRRRRRRERIEMRGGWVYTDGD